MSEEYLMLEEVQVEVSGFFTTHHWFNTESEMWGELVFPAFSGYGVIQTPDGRELLMQKTHWLGSAHEFVDGETGFVERPTKRVGPAKTLSSSSMVRNTSSCQKACSSRDGSCRTNREPS